MVVPDLWLVALSAAAAAAVAVLGVIPVIVSGEVSPRLGWANALAAGLMLGAGYVLLQQGIALSPVDGEYALFDSIYLGKAPADFELAKP